MALPVPSFEKVGEHFCNLWPTNSFSTWELSYNGATGSLVSAV